MDLHDAGSILILPLENPDPAPSLAFDPADFKLLPQASDRD
jgi:hypothetical protein